MFERRTMKYRRTGAWWFLKQLWDYYCPHFIRPEYGGGVFLIGLAVVPEDRLLPALRSLWARHLRSLRLDKDKREIASLWLYRMSTGSGDPYWHVMWPRYCQLRRRKYRPRLTEVDILTSLSAFAQ